MGPLGPEQVNTIAELMRRAQLVRSLPSVAGDTVPQVPSVGKPNPLGQVGTPGAAVSPQAPNEQLKQPVPNAVPQPQAQAQNAPQVPPQGMDQPPTLPPQGQPQGPQALGQALGQTPQINAPVPPTNRDEAKKGYLDMLSQGAPSQADYHPSVLRTILAGLLGAATGITDPEGGKKVSSQIAFGPYQKQMTAYQQRLAEKKQAYETEEGSAKDEASIGEVKQRGAAEVSRAGAEEARRQAEEAKAKELEPGTPQYQGAIEKLKIQHPGSSKVPDLYELPLKNGETVVATRNAQGEFTDSTGLVIGLDTYDASKIHKVGTSVPKDPKDPAEKNRTEYNDYYNGMKQKNPNMSDDEIAGAYTAMKAKTSSQFEKPPQSLMIGPDLRAQLVRPGTQVAPGSTTAAGLSSEDVPTAQTRQMAETAPKVIDLIDRTSKLIGEQVKTLGPASSRWNEFMSGKVGAPNPEFMKLRTNAALLQTLLLRMHLGARGGQQMMAHFKDLIDTGKQSPENMKAALEEIKNYANDVQKTGKSGEKKDVPKIEDLRKKYNY